MGPESEREPGFESSGTFEAIAALPRMAGTLAAALPRALEIACGPGGLALGRAHVHPGSAEDATNAVDAQAAELWQASLPERRAAPVRKAASAGADLRPGLAGDEGLRVTRLAGRDLGPVEHAARRAGFHSVVHLDVLAERRPIASLQLFSTTELEPGDPRLAALALLRSQLEQIATRERLRDAVRAAARHARGSAAGIEALRSQLEIRSAQVENLRTELAEQEAEREVRRYREKPRAGVSEGTAMTGGAPRPVPADAAPPRPVRTAPPAPEGTALLDPRTSLPLRPILEDRIEQAIRRRQRSPKNLFAVLAVAVDGLDRVALEADREGRDTVITALSRRLVAQSRSADTVAHLDDATFVLVLEDIRVLDEAVRIAERIAKELQRPIRAGSRETRLVVRVGIVFGGPAYDRADPVLHDAIAALARAEPEGTSVAVFDEAAQHEEEIRRRIEVELGRALAEDQLYLEYQPIVSLADGRIAGLETLLRWRHPEHGLIPPGQFIPIAARSPMIHDLGAWLLERTCEQIRRWQEELGHPVPTVDLNVTASQLFHERTAARIRDMLARFGLPGEQLRFDIPESELMRDPVRAGAGLERIRTLGCRIAVDDFGTGFSSLRHLHALPIDAVKIDRAFVSGGEGRENLSVARTIVELARMLGAEVIAEGIETRDQFRVLRSMGCRQAQGFLFSPPIGAAKVIPLLREGYPLETGP
jgi:EAL domain-containing protein (putative c-di-GMP-specific phosphodiesterase class I)/GGDEF domain-containing protein